MRLKKDEEAQSHRAEDSAVTSPNNPLSRTYPDFWGMAKHVRCESSLAEKKLDCVKFDCLAVRLSTLVGAWRD